jgi:ADP-ribosylarginine hydrolase
MKDMSGRAPGSTCIRSASILNTNGKNWKDIPFQKNGGGCGASMRAACIGLYYWNDLSKLVEVSIETGRTTHHNPLGYLGALVAALFTAFAIQNIPPREWLTLLLKIYLPQAEEYVRYNREAEDNLGEDWKAFIKHW